MCSINNTLYATCNYRNWISWKKVFRMHASNICRVNLSSHRCALWWTIVWLVPDCSILLFSVCFYFAFVCVSLILYFDLYDFQSFWNKTLTYLLTIIETKSLCTLGSILESLREKEKSFRAIRAFCAENFYHCWPRKRYSNHPLSEVIL